MQYKIKLQIQKGETIYQPSVVNKHFHTHLKILCHDLKIEHLILRHLIIRK